MFYYVIMQHNLTLNPHHIMPLSLFLTLTLCNYTWFHNLIKCSECVVNANNTKVCTNTCSKEGKRLTKRPTVFYLMHCGKALYNNLLWRNWERDTLPLLTIIGNSFSGIQERCVHYKPFTLLTEVRDVLTDR